MSPFRFVSMIVFAAALCALGSAQNSVYELSAKTHKVQVRILALSSAARQAYAGSQDTYFAEVIDHGHETGNFIKLVDRYSVWESPIRRSLLREQRVLRMSLKRDEGCDTRASSMHVSFDPDDTFSQALPVLLQKQGIGMMPCFVADHGATRLSK